jgi:hypothetical protein
MCKTRTRDPEMLDGADVTDHALEPEDEDGCQRSAVHFARMINQHYLNHSIARGLSGSVMYVQRHS